MLQGRVSFFVVKIAKQFSPSHKVIRGTTLIWPGKMATPFFRALIAAITGLPAGF
jgi:hypothetical protein